jgi:drug/metabolite transporter (DMT)-like permease
MILALMGGTVIALSDASAWQAGLVCPDASEFLQGKAMWGNFLALAGAWTVTGYLLIGRRLRAKMSLVPYIFLVYGMAAVVLIFIMFAFGDTPFGFPPLAYVWMLLLALVPQLIGHSTYNWTLRYMPAAFVAVTTLGEPIGSTILAYIILQEQPGWIKVVGGIFILAGIYLAGRIEKQKQ